MPAGSERLLRVANRLRYYISAHTVALSPFGAVPGARIRCMRSFFDSFNKGCGCVLGLVAGLIIASIILALVFGDFRVGF